MPYAAIVLAGGAARRMGGGAKPLLVVAGRTLLDRVLAAVAEASPVVVVGPAELSSELPGDVVLTRESPAGGGPVAAIAAGLTAAVLAGDRAGVPMPPLTVVCAGDLPFLTSYALERLCAATSDHDVACFVDDDGRAQSLCAVWRTATLAGALPVDPAGQSLRSVHDRARAQGARLAGLRWTGTQPPPWFDCDTPEQLEQAERMIT
jgi:molybdenum cofactor guanylyltransferase